VQRLAQAARDGGASEGRGRNERAAVLLRLLVDAEAAKELPEYAKKKADGRGRDFKQFGAILVKAKGAVT